MKSTLLFFQPLDQFDIYYLNNINSHPIFGIFFNKLFYNLGANDLLFLNLSIYLLLLLTIIYIFTSSILLKKLKLISSTL